jgi:hypothetical protein
MSAEAEKLDRLIYSALRELSRERLKPSLKMMTGLMPWSSRLRKNALNLIAFTSRRRLTCASWSCQ